MTEDNLKQIVEKMKSSGMNDESIEADLVVGGHDAAMIDIVLGRKKSEDTAGIGADLSEPAPVTPTPAAHPQIIKDRTLPVSRAQKDEEINEGTDNTTAANASRMNSRKLVLKPTHQPKVGADPQPEPVVEVGPKPERPVISPISKPTPEPDPTDEEEEPNPNDFDAVISSLTD